MLVYSPLIEEEFDLDEDIQEFTLGLSNGNKVRRMFSYLLFTGTAWKMGEVIRNMANYLVQREFMSSTGEVLDEQFVDEFDVDPRDESDFDDELDIELAY